jgi:hypothetical protein
MACAGLQGAQTSPNGHAYDAIMMGFELLRVAGSMCARNGRKIVVRIGIHSGAVLSGVVGDSKPQYCLFGDTVNTAARMQAKGERMEIHISDQTHQALIAAGEDEEFEFEPRVVVAKGKGELHTFLCRLKTAGGSGAGGTATGPNDDAFGEQDQRSRLLPASHSVPLGMNGMHAGASGPPTPGSAGGWLRTRFFPPTPGRSPLSRSPATLSEAPTPSQSHKQQRRGGPPILLSTSPSMFDVGLDGVSRSASALPSPSRTQHLLAVGGGGGAGGGAGGGGGPPFDLSRDDSRVSTHTHLTSTTITTLRGGGAGGCGGGAGGGGGHAGPGGMARLLRRRSSQSSILGTLGAAGVDPLRSAQVKASPRRGERSMVIMSEEQRRVEDAELAQSMRSYDLAFVGDVSLLEVVFDRSHALGSLAEMRQVLSIFAIGQVGFIVTEGVLISLEENPLQKYSAYVAMASALTLLLAAAATYTLGPVPSALKMSSAEAAHVRRIRRVVVATYCVYGALVPVAQVAKEERFGANSSAVLIFSAALLSSAGGTRFLEVAAISTVWFGVWCACGAAGGFLLNVGGEPSDEEGEEYALARPPARLSARPPPARPPA